MSVFANCQDARNMKSIIEMDCSECGEKDALEIILMDGITVGESVCGACGYVIPEGLHLNNFRKNKRSLQ